MVVMEYVVMRTAWMSAGDTSEVPLDPLQRRRELIEHYRRHELDERAAYLEREHEGPILLRRVATLKAQRDDLLPLLADLIAWWTGSPSDGPKLGAAFRKAIEAERDAGPSAASGRTRNSRYAEVENITEDVLVAGLLARVNTLLRPIPLVPTAGYMVFEMLRTLRVHAAGEQQPLRRVEFPAAGPSQGAMWVHVAVCERCPFVDLRPQATAYCFLCRRRHALKPGAVLMPKLITSEPWGIKGWREVHLHRCEVCGKAFLGNSDARACSPRCRTARHRSTKPSIAA